MKYELKPRTKAYAWVQKREFWDHLAQHRRGYELWNYKWRASVEEGNRRRKTPLKSS